MTKWRVDGYSLKLETAPANPLVTLAEVKEALNVVATDEDTFLQMIIDAAISMVDGPESKTGKCMVNQVWKYFVPTPWDSIYRSPRLYLPAVPLVSVDQIQYYDVDDNLQTQAVSEYRVVNSGEDWAYIEPKPGFSWPSNLSDRDDAFQVTLTAGYGEDASDCPDAIRHAVNLIAGHWYEHREAVISSGAVPQELPMGVEALISRHAIGWISS